MAALFGCFVRFLEPTTFLSCTKKLIMKIYLVWVNSILLSLLSRLFGYSCKSPQVSWRQLHISLSAFLISRLVSLKLKKNCLLHSTYSFFLKHITQVLTSFMWIYCTAAEILLPIIFYVRGKTLTIISIFWARIGCPECP